MTISTERKIRSLNISLSSDLYQEIETVAREENRSKSEVMREAFRYYRFARRWQTIREWGKQTARDLQIMDEEVLETFLE